MHEEKKDAEKTDIVESVDVVLPVEVVEEHHQDGDATEDVEIL
jgi:hypothetical protein